MIHLNECNGADKITLKYATQCVSDFTGGLQSKVYGCEMGIAYGGGVEAIGKAWKGKGTIYGFDTFEGHPKHLTTDDREATCMDHWYKDSIYGTSKLSLEYQQSQLDEQGLDNVKLIKGEVHKDSCKDIPILNYALLDMDILESMENGYAAVRDKIVTNGFLFLHDVVEPSNIIRLYNWFYDVVLQDRDEKGERLWHIEGLWPGEHLAGLRRRAKESLYERTTNSI